MSFYSRDDFSPDNSVGYLTKRVFQASLQGMAPLFDEEGLSYLQWSALVSIWFDRGPTCASLARDLGHDAGATTRLIDGLEQRGLVARVRSEEDRRVVNLSLTHAGAEMARTVRLRVIDWWNERLAGWERADVERLVGYLQRLRGELEAPCA